MPKQLTPKQEKQVKEHHRQAVMNMHKRKIITRKPLSLEEASKLLPGIIIQHTVSGDERRLNK